MQVPLEAVLGYIAVGLLEHLKGSNFFKNWTFMFILRGAGFCNDCISDNDSVGK